MSFFCNKWASMAATERSYIICEKARQSGGGERDLESRKDGALIGVIFAQLSGLSRARRVIAVGN